MHRRKVIPYIAVVVVMAVSLPLHAEIHVVPRDFGTIQEAFDHASVGDGDTIHVYPGTYSENVNYKGKDILLHGGRTVDIPLPDSVTIDAFGEDSSAVTVDSIYGNITEIRGFTITGGTVEYTIGN